MHGPSKSCPAHFTCLATSQLTQALHSVSELFRPRERGINDNIRHRQQPSQPFSQSVAHLLVAINVERCLVTSLTCRDTCVMKRMTPAGRRLWSYSPSITRRQTAVASSRRVLSFHPCSITAALFDYDGSTRGAITADVTTGPHPAVPGQRGTNYRDRARRGQYERVREPGGGFIGRFSGKNGSSVPRRRRRC